MTFKYPKTHSAANRTQQDQWSLGDALLEECGPPSGPRPLPGVNNGSYGKLREAQQELAICGIEFHVATLCRYRDTSFWFPPTDRVAGVSHPVHATCGTPEMLRAILAGRAHTSNGPPNREECRRIIRELRRQRDATNVAERKVLNKAAERKVKAAERKLKAAREALQEARISISDFRKVELNLENAREEFNKVPERPKGDPLTPPSLDQVPRLLLISRLLSIGFKAQSLAREAEKMLKESGLHDFDPDDIGGVIEAALNAHRKWNEFARTLQKLPGAKGAQVSPIASRR